MDRTVLLTVQKSQPWYTLDAHFKINDILMLYASHTEMKRKLDNKVDWDQPYNSITKLKSQPTSSGIISRVF